MFIYSKKEAWQPTPVFFAVEPHGQRSLVGYSPGVAESDSTEQLSMYREKPWKMKTEFSSRTQGKDAYHSFENIQGF